MGGFVWLLLMSAGLARPLAGIAVDPSDDRSVETKPAPFDPEAFVMVPLEVFVLQSDAVPEADCALTDADLVRILNKVNGVWHQAGIHFRLSAPRRLQAANEERFLARHALLGDRPPPLDLFRLLIPEEVGDRGGLRVFYVHELPVNGVYFGEGVAMVKETAALREVEGGIDEPLPRVTSHELGHALGLSHRQARTNLMASGTTGTRLNTTEVERARAGVLRWSGAMSVAEARAEERAALERGDAKRVQEIRRWLDELTGAGASKREADPPEAPLCSQR